MRPKTYWPWHEIKIYIHNPLIYITREVFMRHSFAYHNLKTIDSRDQKLTHVTCCTSGFNITWRRQILGPTRNKIYICWIPFWKRPIIDNGRSSIDTETRGSSIDDGARQLRALSIWGSRSCDVCGWVGHVLFLATQHTTKARAVLKCWNYQYGNIIKMGYAAKFPV